MTVRERRSGYRAERLTGTGSRHIGYCAIQWHPAHRVGRVRQYRWLARLDAFRLNWLARIRPFGKP